MIWIDLKINNTITNDPCVLCGARCDPCGLDFFLGETWELVCDDCAWKYAPDLCKLISLRGGNIMRLLSLDHFIGVCLLCLKPGTLISIRGMGFFYCETDHVYWDQSCDRHFFQLGHEYDQDESDKNEALVKNCYYIEREVGKVFEAIRRAQIARDGGPANEQAPLPPSSTPEQLVSDGDCPF